MLGDIDQVRPDREGINWLYDCDLRNWSKRPVRGSTRLCRPLGMRGQSARGFEHQVSVVPGRTCHSRLPGQAGRPTPESPTRARRSPG